MVEKSATTERISTIGLHPVGLAALLFSSAASFAAEAWKEAEVGGAKIYTDAKGMTLYTFDKDAGGKSMCNGPCAENWPALVAGDADKPAGDMTIVVRDDGKKMWAYKGKPLYTFRIPRPATSMAMAF